MAHDGGVRARLDVRGEALYPTVALQCSVAVVVVAVKEHPRPDGAHRLRDCGAIAGACRGQFNLDVTLKPGQDGWCVVGDQ